jgi:4,5-dihydroxyphthalate decarboxylase
MRELGTLRYMLPWMASEIEEIDDVFGGDPWPYGIEPNRQTLEALVQYLAEQALIEKAVPVEDLFVPIHGQEAKP